MPTAVINRPPTEIVGRFTRSAPIDLNAMADALGLEVDTEVLPPDTAGKIERVGQVYHIILNGRDNVRRQRFTLAHELAHYLLHRDLIGDGVTDSGMYRSRLSDDIERQANRFAADLLMPAALVREYWREGIQAVEAMAKKFDVSRDAARIRMRDLGYDPAG